MPAAAAARLRHRANATKDHMETRRTSTRTNTALPPIRSDVEGSRAAARPGGAGRRRVRMRSAHHVPRPDQQEQLRLRLQREEEAAAARRASRVAGASPLMYACQQGRDVHVRTLLQEKPERALARDRTMKSALHYCAENASAASAELVLAAAPELLDARDEDGFTALHLAVIAGNVSLVRFLLHRRADLAALDNESHSVVHWATVCGEVEALEALLDAGAAASSPDIHGGYPIHYAAQMCGVNSEMGNDPHAGLTVLRTLLSRGVDVHVKDQDSRQPILWAASAGSADAVLALVNAGANVEADDKDGLTALHCAASRGHTECLETLVTLCGAEVNVIDSNGCTALFYAVTLGHADCTQLLLNFGAEPNRQDRKGRTAAHCGAAKGQLETLKLLGAAGADLWTRNVRGDLPLHEAIQSGRRELVRWLLAQRPDAITAANNDGRTALHIAALNNNVEMCKVAIDAQSLVNPVMRGAKGQMMTPLDAALLRGNRGCAKYLQLHGGVPASKLTEEAAAIRGPQRAVTESQMAGLASSVTPATMELLTPRGANELGLTSATPSPRLSANLLQVPPSDQTTQTHEGMFTEQPAVDTTSGSARRSGDSSHKSRRTRVKKSPKPPASSSDSEVASEAPSSSSRRQRSRSSRRPARAKRKSAEPKHSASEEDQGSPVSRDTVSPLPSSVVVADVHQEETVTEPVIKSRETREESKERKAKSSSKRERKRTASGSKRSKSRSEKKGSNKHEKSVVNETNVLDEQQKTSTKEEKIINEHKTSDNINISESKTKTKIERSIDDSKISISDGKLEKSVTDENVIHTQTDATTTDSKTASSSKDKTTSESVVSDENKQSSSDSKISSSVSESKQSVSETIHSEVKTNESINKATILTKDGESERNETSDTQSSLKSEEKSTDKSKRIQEKLDKAEAALKHSLSIETEDANKCDTSSKEESSKIKTSSSTESQKEVTIRASVEHQSESKESFDSVIEKKDSTSNGNSITLAEKSTCALDNTLKEHGTLDLETKNNKESTQGKCEVSKTEHKKSIEKGQSEDDQIDKSNRREDGSVIESKKQNINLEGNGNTASSSIIVSEVAEIEVKNTEIFNTSEINEVTTDVLLIEEVSKDGNNESIEKIETKNHAIGVQENEVSSDKNRVENKKQTNTTKGSNFTDEDSSHFEQKTNFRSGKGLVMVVDMEEGTENSRKENIKSKKTRRKTERLESEKQSTSNSEKDDGRLDKAPVKGTARVKPLLRTSRSKSREGAKDTAKQRKDARNKVLRVGKSSEEETSHSLRSTQSSIEEVSEGSTRSKATDSGVMLVDSVSGSPQLPRHRLRKPTIQRPAGATRSSRLPTQTEKRLQLRPTRNDLVDDARKARELIRQRNQHQVVSVTQAVQVSTRKYQQERRIFQELLELKRLQIRAGRSNEQVLVKRAVDEYRRAGLIVGLRQYDGPYHFQDFENYLYEQLRLLQHGSDARMVPRLKPSDDVESLSAALRRTLPGMPGALHHTAAFCTLSTHRCRHATEAYTSIPVAAYVSRTSPIPRTADGFLPRIEANPSRRTSPNGAPRSASRALQHVDPSRPVTLELSHGGERQVIALPTERLDRTKRYYVTFTIKPGDGQAAAMAAATEQQHRHAKSL